MNNHLIQAAPDLLALAIQYRDDLRRPVTDSGSIERRLEAVDAAIAKATRSVKETQE